MPVDRLLRSPLVALVLLLGAMPAARAADLAACSQAVQVQADQALAALERRQAAEDEALRSHPTASYATMNGPVLRELEKRQQREQSAQRLQEQAGKSHHCQLQGADFN